MRPIKFRAWDEAKKEMFTPYELTFAKRGVHVRDGKYVGMRCTERLNGACVLMQFTGLLDKNGKEIYEGDIICYENCNYTPDNGENPNVLKEVQWGIGCFTTGEFELWELEGDNIEMEVIGNIYENPELLK